MAQSSFARLPPKGRPLPQIVRPSANARDCPRRTDRIKVSAPGHVIALRPRPSVCLLPELSTRKSEHIPTSGVPPDWNETTAAVKAAADKGDPASQFVYANIMFHGRGCPIDRRTAKRYFQRAADAGHAGAQFQFAEILMFGWGIPKNPADSAKYFHRAAINGHVDAMYEWGKCLQEGTGTAKDPNEAERWFRNGADLDHVQCQMECGQMREAAGDLRTAYRYYQMAASLGNPAAVQRCASLAERLK
jgi:TPR repeat protein